MSPAPFHVLIPARLGSMRLPRKPLADIGGAPMVVRVAQRALASQALSVTVAADDTAIVQACQRHGIAALLTRPDHASGSDRLAEACTLLGWPDEALVVNLQGDEPLMAPELLQAVAQQLQQRPDCVMSTAAHPIDELAEFLNPNVVKVVLDGRNTALYFSRSPIPAARDFAGLAWWSNGRQGGKLPRPLRHIGIYAYRVGFLRQFPSLPQAPLEQLESLEQLRVLWHGHRIAVHIAEKTPGPGVDTPEDLERARRLFS
ncbi:MAG: 3-deoxy-manno-octulosonate cytidylyltransferase [Serpentinimonas sp.]|nr:3-deoxy-manno-octulosonate cytidylyltransferase [Serpentinimonas sp.]